ncbi:ATP synthase F1 subunit epsilon [Gemmatimonas sp.]|uniref:ATP synthase F1 subunit epsilon n=1 Tax=Gemmatimonas sp. TaxID=1962908 RepID=UPI0022BB3957|nr:ATP synthase F1 subunit epsilon [Gemmatimonas sp.]MCA2984328.1 ATP synthase F1 subunit epsilon [Gemmatimonas sp.]MCA2987387.1 ATP synthase F1 subunit epsilon [Gemmatimonas sp.]MCA2992841.1 ATP synthase F1 subunit epsilon [Gemmatimonas sp.]MCA2996856.1 ATP synthase F1 subunit epsilon [Gemmatimonas sp.]MCE2955306.1 ATP synthase F1 subunit epsilon [Gemmatimonas sp.]
MAELKVSVISPERVLYEGAARGVIAPAFDGEVGILPMHAPLMTLLGRGVLRVDTAGGEQRFQVDGGFLQVVDDAVRVVTEQASAV